MLDCNSIRNLKSQPHKLRNDCRSNVRELFHVEFPNDWSIALMRIDGTDSDLSKIARTSRDLDEDQRTSEQDLKLITRLLKDDHGSPIEFCSLTMLIVCPMYVRSQWMRHRMANYSEKSGRYAQPDQLDIQTKAQFKFRTQDLKNHQMSDDKLRDLELEDCDEVTLQMILNKKFQNFNKEAKFLYDWFIGVGVSREQARMILPMMTLTKFYTQMNLRSLINFLKLRCASDAQPEIQLYAKTIRDNFLPYAFPQFHKALVDLKIIAPFS